MKAKLVRESLNERRNVIKPITTTVDELFNWYAGEGWEDDWQTTNAMSIDDEHAQDNDDDGMAALKFLADNRNEQIEVEIEDFGNAYDLSFFVAGRPISIQSIDIPFEGDDSFNGNDELDLDQEIYDRNPDYDVD